MCFIWRNYWEMLSQGGGMVECTFHKQTRGKIGIWSDALFRRKSIRIDMSKNRARWNINKGTEEGGRERRGRQRRELRATLNGCRSSALAIDPSRFHRHIPHILVGYILDIIKQVMWFQLRFSALFWVSQSIVFVVWLTGMYPWFK